MKKLLCMTALSAVLCAATPVVLAADSTPHKSASETRLIKATYALPKDAGEEFRQTLHAADEENLQSQQQVMLDHADMYDILTAPEFDSKAFLAKAEEVRKLQAQEKEKRDDAFASAASQLSAEDRATLAHALDTGSPHKGGKHAHHKQMTSNTSATPASDDKTISQ